MDKTRFQEMVEQDRSNTPISLSLERLAKVLKVNTSASKQELNDALEVVQWMNQQISQHMMFATNDRNPKRGHQRVESLFEMGAVNTGLTELLMTHPEWPAREGFDDDCE
jgi:hypothetical protein